MDERTVLEHYQLSTPYPTEWPAEKDMSDASDDDLAQPSSKGHGVRRSKTRYSALERSASDRRSGVPGAQKSGNGTQNLVSKDEPDPLGSTDSVVMILRSQGLPVQSDINLRNQFLLSSNTFSPALFLSRVHGSATTQDLLRGLDILSRSIDQKSASLKVLVESNFERFVKAKATIDNVYMEMKNRGSNAAEISPTRNKQHSRHTSRTSMRNNSGDFRGSISVTAAITSTDTNRKKNALTKESEYGVLGIKLPLIDVSAKAEEVWGPALSGIEKEDALKVVASTVSRNKDAYEVGSAIVECIKRKDYENLVEEYTKAKRIADDAKRLGDRLLQTSKIPTDSEVQQLLVAARMWTDVQEQVGSFKRDIFRKLSSGTQPSNKSDTGQDQPLEIIGILLELGVQDNPIWIWLMSRYDHLKNKIQAISDRSKVEIEVLRRGLARNQRPPSQVIANHLRSVGKVDADGHPIDMDSSDILELWERIYLYLSGMLSAQGLLGEVMEFWQTVEGFIEGRTQKTLPIGIDGESREHHTLSPSATSELKRGTVELVDMIRSSVSEFFQEPPLEDISALFSPLPPLTPSSPTPTSAGLTPTSLRDPRFAFSASNPPPPSPRLGEAFEKYAFWPPWSNSISGVHYLSKLLALIGTGAGDMAGIAPVMADNQALDGMRIFVGQARDRCVNAIVAAWVKDASHIKDLEDWKRSPEKHDITRMPASFSAFESAILSGMQKILYIPEATNKAGSASVVTPPPSKSLQMVRSQFVTTLYKALSGVVENAEMPIKSKYDDWNSELQTATSGAVDAADRNVRMLLTLSNLLALRVDMIPNLTTQFENAFSVKLTDETKTIRDVLTQIDERLFRSYTRPIVENLRTIIRNGILGPDWAPKDKPSEVKPYVYSALLSLVLVHTQVSTTAWSLTYQILTYLLEQMTLCLLEAFKARGSYTLAELMQATLDIEFVAQTLTQYTTEKAGETQSAIYQELDRGTDDKARRDLQAELPAMRGVLKSLRESSRSEFLCFRKTKRPGPGLERVQTG